MIKTKYFGFSAAFAAIVLWGIGLFYLKGMGHFGFSWNVDGLFKWHLACGVLGVITAFIIIKTGYRQFLKLTPYATAVAVFLLAWTLYYPIVWTAGGVYIDKVQLYLSFGYRTLVIFPSELAKIAFCMLLAVLLPYCQQKRLDGKWFADALFCLPLFVFGMFLTIQGDWKNLFLLIAVFATAMTLLKPFSWSCSLGLFAGIGTAVWFIVNIAMWHMRFMEAFCGERSGNVSSAIMKTASWFGNGIAPGSDTIVDMKFAHSVMMIHGIAWQSGVIMLIVITLLYGILIFSGVMVALRCCDEKGKILCAAATVFLTGQLLQNLAVIFSLIGFSYVTPLFIGYGGSNLLFAFAALGCVVSVACSKETASPAEVCHER